MPRCAGTPQYVSSHVAQIPFRISSKNLPFPSTHSAIASSRSLSRRADRDNRVFVGGLLALLAAMTTVALSHHLGVTWVAMEAATLATAPLIYFNHNARSLEAAWKYLLIGSLGIALALLGTFFLALSGAAPGGPRSLVVEELVRSGPSLARPWVRAAFVFLLVGYGTKMGLAPLHSWKPDAYGEAPGIVGALLAGGLTNFAFVAIVRVFQVTRAAGEEAFARDALVGLGLLSVALAAVFVVGQKDFKRMLAYSSVEHMGILALGIGLGGGAAAGAFFHCLNNGLTKGVVFLSAGNIHRAFGAKTTDEVRGAARLLPLSGPLFLAGFLAVTGSPRTMISLRVQSISSPVIQTAPDLIRSPLYARNSTKSPSRGPQPPRACVCLQSNP